MAQNSFKNIRIFILIMILLFVALYSCEQKRASTSWYKTVEIIIYPINVDGSDIVDKYIKTLKDKNFTRIDKFTSRQAKKYKLILSKPTKTRLGQQIKILPPVPPEPRSGILSIITWSIKFDIGLEKHA